MADRKRNIRMDPLVYRILKPALKTVLGRLLNVKVEVPDEISSLEPPYLIIANHQGFWDPFLIGMYLNHPVFFITSDAVFRSRFFNLALKFLGAIPKTKAKSDIDALKHILDIKKQGQIIGLFPEGRRTWDGASMPLVLSTSKLVRMLKVPVVCVKFKGGYFSHPRWGRSLRRGELRMEYSMVLSAEKLSKMRVAEIHRVIADAVRHDEHAWQSGARIAYRGRKLAENIEQFLFACPVCKSIGKISSGGNRFSCGGCGRIWEVDEYQQFKGLNGEPVYRNGTEWNSWQLDYLKEYLENGVGNGDLLLTDTGLIFHTGYKSRIPEFFAKGRMELYAETLRIIDDEETVLSLFGLDELSGINIQNREVFEFYHDNVLYTVNDAVKRFCSFKWLKAFEILQKEKITRFHAD